MRILPIKVEQIRQLKYVSLLFAFLTLSVLSNSVYSTELTRIDAGNFITILSKENFDYSKKVSNNLMKSSNSRTDFLLNKENLNNAFLVQQSVYLENFPIGEGKLGNLRLYQAQSAIDENTRINIYYNGQVIQGNIPDIKIYSGNIDGDQESDVILLISPSGISGIIQTGYGQQYNLGQNQINDTKVNQIQSEGNLLYTLVLSDRNESDYRTGLAQSCGVSDIEQNPNGYKDLKFDDEEIRNNLTKQNKINATSILEATIAMEGNYEFFLMFKSNKNDPNDNVDNQKAIAKSTEYMLQVMSMASLVYQREVNITLKIGNVDLYADKNKDPYFSVYNQILTAKLERMRSAWSARGAVKRTVVSLFTNLRAQPSNSVIAGIAYTGSPASGVVCNTYQGYNALGMIGSFEYPTMNFTTDVNVASHEIGHNFSSPHTHNCYWDPPLDTCLTKETDPGTDACIQSGALRRIKYDGDIMSYCHLRGASVLHFHPRVKQLIRTAAMQASCITSATKPTLQLVRPKGQEKFISGDIENINWNVYNVSRINIELSTDGGQTWQTIVKDLNAVSDSTYKWKVPNVKTSNAFIKIVSVLDNGVTDESITPFEIQVRGIEILSPAENQEIGYSVPYNINWVKSAVDEVKLSYSTDGGNTWMEVAGNTNALNASYSFPKISTDKAVLKIVSLKQPNVVNIRNFKIGKEKVEFLTPNVETTLCDTLKKLEFSFNSHYANKIVIWVSLDNKQTWVRTHIGAINIAAGVHSWDGTGVHSWAGTKLVPTDKMYIKATVFTGDNNDVIGQAGPFTVTSCSATSSVVEENLNFSVSNLSPNPANDLVLADINFKAGDFTNQHLVSIQIVDITGAVVKTINIPDTFTSGKLELDIKDLTQGTYFVKFTSNQGTLSRTLQVVRK